MVSLPLPASAEGVGLAKYKNQGNRTMRDCGIRRPMQKKVERDDSKQRRERRVCVPLVLYDMVGNKRESLNRVYGCFWARARLLRL